jgi:hypothetical protein
MMKPVQSVLASNAKPIARMLMQKRDAFDHEREVRFLYQSHTGGDYASAGLDDSVMCLPKLKEFEIDGSTRLLAELIQLPFDWKLVSGVMIGPRTEAKVAQTIEAKIRSVAPWMALSRSDLYGPPAYAGQF